MTPRGIGWATVIVLIGSLLYATYLGVQNQRDDKERQDQINCVNAWLGALSVRLDQRSVWAAEDKEALNKMLRKVVNTHSDDRAVRAYIHTIRENDHKRKTNQYPDRTC